MGRECLVRVTGGAELLANIPKHWQNQAQAAQNAPSTQGLPALDHVCQRPQLANIPKRWQNPAQEAQTTSNPQGLPALHHVCQHQELASIPNPGKTRVESPNHPARELNPAQTTPNSGKTQPKRPKPAQIPKVCQHFTTFANACSWQTSPNAGKTRPRRPKPPRTPKVCQHFTTFANTRNRQTPQTQAKPSPRAQNPTRKPETPTHPKRQTGPEPQNPQVRQFRARTAEAIGSLGYPSWPEPGRRRRLASQRASPPPPSSSTAQAAARATFAPVSASSSGSK